MSGWQATTVYTLPNVVFTGSQQKAVFANYTLNNSSYLNNLLGAIRSIKSDKEAQVLRIATEVSGQAHMRVMQETARGNLRYEYQVAGLFHEISEGCGGWTHQSYLSIVGAGPRSAVLHYNTNYEPIKTTDMVLVDAAAEFFGYGSDITRTWPSSGKFTDRQITCYNIVLACQNAALAYYMPGQRYSDASSAVITTLLQGLLNAGMVRGTIAELRANSINSLFLPHGLGHHVGLDVHDPGSLSTFAAGMLVTCEPGLYFIPALLEPAFANPTKAQYLNQDVIMAYMNENGVGGYRIEDMVYITSTGQEIWSGNVPRTVADIERLMGS
jgi:Xaa-Pro dipeptidase